MIPYLFFSFPYLVHSTSASHTSTDCCFYVYCHYSDMCSNVYGTCELVWDWKKNRIWIERHGSMALNVEPWIFIVCYVCWYVRPCQDYWYSILEYSICAEALVNISLCRFPVSGGARRRWKKAHPPYPTWTKWLGWGVVYSRKGLHCGSHALERKTGSWPHNQLFQLNNEWENRPHRDLSGTEHDGSWHDWVTDNKKYRLPCVAVTASPVVCLSIWRTSGRSSCSRIGRKKN